LHPIHFFGVWKKVALEMMTGSVVRSSTRALKMTTSSQIMVWTRHSCQLDVQIASNKLKLMAVIKSLVKSRSDGG
jgi:hypothetical protein